MLKSECVNATTQRPISPNCPNEETKKQIGEFNRNRYPWSRFSICDSEFPSDFLWRRLALNVWFHIFNANASERWKRLHRHIHIHIFHDPFAAIRSRVKVHLNPSYVQSHIVLKWMDRKFTLAVFEADFTIFAINQAVIYGQRVCKLQFISLNAIDSLLKVECEHVLSSIVFFQKTQFTSFEVGFVTVSYLSNGVDQPIELHNWAVHIAHFVW